MPYYIYIAAQKICSFVNVISSCHRRKYHENKMSRNRKIYLIEDYQSVITLTQRKFLYDFNPPFRLTLTTPSSYYNHHHHHHRCSRRVVFLNIHCLTVYTTYLPTHKQVTLVIKHIRFAYSCSVLLSLYGWYMF